MWTLRWREACRMMSLREPRRQLRKRLPRSQLRKRLPRSQLRKSQLRSQLRKKSRMSRYQPLFLKKGCNWSDVGAFSNTNRVNPNSGDLAGVN